MSKKYQLKNGLKVLLIESHKSPVVSIQMWVKTGSADEGKKEEGISHFIEHLVFKGTDKFKVGEIASTVEGSGGELNAYTSFDQTVFYVTISSHFTDVGLDVISQMMGYPTFDPKEIDNEREVVIEEIKRGEDSPQRQISQMLFSTAYKKHAYKVPVIGYAKNIKTVSAKKIKDYFHSRYAPKNMFLVVAGDFKSAEMKKKVETFFGGFKDYKIKKIKRAKEPVQKKVQVQVKETPFQEALSYIAFKAPNVKHKDVTGLEVLALIFGQGDSSRLVKELRINAPIVNSTGAFAFTPQDDGLVAVSASLDPNNLKDYYEKLKQEMAKMIQEPPSNEELQKAITNLASEQVYSLESVDGLARKAGSLEFYMGDPNYYQKYLKQLYALKPKDIQKLAIKYFDPKKLTVVLMTKNDLAEAKKITNQFIKDLGKEIALAKKKPNKNLKTKKFAPKKFKFNFSLDAHKPATEEITLKNNVKLYLREQKETPTCSLKMAFLGGVRIEKDSQLGLAELYSRVWPTGSKKYNEHEINLKIDNMAAGLSAFSGRNTVGLSLSYLSNNETEMLDIASDVILNPTWEKEIIEREKQIQTNQIQSQMDNPAQVCILQFMKEMFHGHPYAKELLGTKESLAGLTVQDFKDYHQQILKSENTYICAVGDFNKEKLVKHLNSIIEGIPQGKKVDKQFGIGKIEKEKLLFKELKKEQTHIVVGYRGLPLGDKDRYTLEVIQSILSGQGGRLFIELRDKNSLAYSVSPIRMEGIEAGYFGGYIGCSPEKVDKSIQMLKAEFEKLCSTAVPQEELQRAQKYLSGSNDIELQRKSTICNGILFDVIYGMDPDETFKATEKYFQVTAQDIIRVSQRIFHSESIISVVGAKPPSSL